MGSVVHEHVGVIILAVFIVIAVFGPVGCIFFTRRREHKKYHPSPKAFRKARTKLGTVADCRRDTEKGLSGDPEWTDNCPICIGPLCPEPHDEAGHEAGREAMVEIKEAASASEPRDAGATGGSGAAEGGAGERSSSASNTAEGGASQARNSAASNAAEGSGTGARSSTATNAEGDVKAQSSAAGNAAEGGGPEARSSTASNAPVSRTVVDLNDPETQASRVERLRLSMLRHRVSTERNVEILRLRSCGHWFHARCLSSWFLIDRYDCPVCRKSYWNGKSKRLGPMQTFLRTEYSPAPTVARMGIGAVV